MLRLRRGEASQHPREKRFSRVSAKGSEGPDVCYTEPRRVSLIEGPDLRLTGITEAMGAIASVNL